ncbi:hypothetical protein ANN_14139, partial [Periplaneta americana]
MADLCEGGNEPPGSLKASVADHDVNVGDMFPCAVRDLTDHGSLRKPGSRVLLCPPLMTGHHLGVETSYCWCPGSAELETQVPIQMQWP